MSKEIEDVLENDTFADSVDIFEYKNKNIYIKEYMRLFITENFIQKLKKNALKGSLRSSRFRSIAWRIFLDCLPEQRAGWLSFAQQLRDEYDMIRNKYNINPYTVNDSNFAHNNPLSQEESSSWNQYFRDNELKTIINQDVVRTFPEIDLFKEDFMQKIMCNILFYFARENPSISYKQGMHELLAPLLFIVHSDQQALLHAQELYFLEYPNKTICNEIEGLLNPQFLEHDAYFMFKQIMETVEPWYSHEIISFKPDSLNFEPFSSSNESNSYSVLGIKLRLINEKILKRFDDKLYYHLFSLQIAPQIFGIRWLRLLFGREFSMPDLLVVWDSIFSDGISFALCDYIFVAMLIAIRKLLLSAHYSQCMQHLMRYPHVSDVHYIIDMALFLRDPLKYRRPTGGFLNVLPSAVLSNAVQIVLPEVEVGKIADVNLKSQPKENKGAKKIIASKSMQNIPFKSANRFIESERKNEKTKLINSTSISESLENNFSKSLIQEMKPLDNFSIINNDKLTFCCNLLTKQIETLQITLANENLKSEDKVFVALAQLKRARDILKGTLKHQEIGESRKYLNKLTTSFSQFSLLRNKWLTK